MQVLPWEKAQNQKSAAGGEMNQREKKLLFEREIGAYALRAVEELQKSGQLADMFFFSRGKSYRISVVESEPPEGLLVEDIQVLE